MASCLTALGLLDDRSSRKIMRKLYRDPPHPKLRRQAARALGILRDPRSTRLLTTTIRQSRDGPRQIAAAITALSFLRDGEALPDLLQMARTHVRMEVRSAAIVGLGHLANKDRIPLLTTLQEGTNYLALTEALLRLLTLV